MTYTFAGKNTGTVTLHNANWKAGYLANASENLKIAAEWFPLEEEAWQMSRAGLKAKNRK